MKRLYAPFNFRGGVSPTYHKETTCNSPLRELPLPPLLTISMSQHLGATAKPLVSADDTVVGGQMIAPPAV